MSEFIINSENYEKLNPSIKKAVELITSSINEKRPVLIRHHADCDGYSGGVAMEHALLALMYKVHRRENDLFYYYRRMPSKAPYYDYSDALKDVSNFLSDRARFERKPPLIIVIDNGSSKQDLLALQTLKAYDAEIIVIDHHPNNSANDDFIDVHINPFLIGSDSNISAGMLCAEISAILGVGIEDFSDQNNLVLIASVSGIADKSDCEEFLKYIDLAKEKNWNLERLQKLAEIIDFVVYHIGYLESRFFIDDLFFGNVEKQNKIIEIVMPQLVNLSIGLQKIFDNYVEKKELNIDGIKFIVAKLNTSFLRVNEYPGRGKVTGRLFSYLVENLHCPVIALGITDQTVTFRISKELKFDVNVIIEHLEEKLPFAMINGGGHAKAGTLRFLSIAKDQVLSELDTYINH